MKKSKPTNYSVLPAKIRYDKRLTANAKILYTEIYLLSIKKGFCFATNKHFEKLYEVSTTSINSWLKQLENLGYIKREITRDRATKEILHRYIRILDKPIPENCNTPIAENYKDNSNKHLIVKVNNKKEKYKKEKKNNPNPRRSC